MMKSLLISYVLIGLAFAVVLPVSGQDLIENPELDKRVKTFLESRRGQWYDMNVPAVDGKLLYDIIIENGYKDALEIGTSTGYSTIWIAWALSKTGGRLITIEIDERRYKKAVANFR